MRCLLVKLHTGFKPKIEWYKLNKQDLVIVIWMSNWANFSLLKIFILLLTMKNINNKINDTSFTTQSCKTNKLTSILFYASWDNNLNPEIANKLLTFKGPVKEASLHCISYKLSKPRSQLKFFPTCHKTVKQT